MGAVNISRKKKLVKTVLISFFLHQTAVSRNGATNVEDQSGAEAPLRPLAK